MSGVGDRRYASAQTGLSRLSTPSTIDLQLTDLPTFRLTDFESPL